MVPVIGEDVLIREKRKIGGIALEKYLNELAHELSVGALWVTGIEEMCARVGAGIVHELSWIRAVAICAARVI